MGQCVAIGKLPGGGITCELTDFSFEIYNKILGASELLGHTRSPIATPRR